MCSLNSLISPDNCCVCFQFTLCLSCLCQYVTKRGRNRWNLGLLFVLFRGSWNCFWKGEKINFFDISNLWRELVWIFVTCFSSNIYCLYVFVLTHAVMCSFGWFMERQVLSNQDLLHFLATSRLEVLDWDLWWN